MLVTLSPVPANTARIVLLGFITVCWLFTQLSWPILVLGLICLGAMVKAPKDRINSITLQSSKIRLRLNPARNVNCALLKTITTPWMSLIQCQEIKSKKYHTIIVTRFCLPDRNLSLLNQVITSIRIKA